MGLKPGSVRRGHGRRPRPPELFDLDADPQELHDLSRDPAATDRLVRWRTRLVAELDDRPEGFVSAGELVAGRPVDPVLPALRACL
ncbi:hypothetical protein ABZS81_11040 [Streptomyces sp. NPDC005318]|uniref:hypothetical protein n=1 Tax=Streptomyces sp. NPDC005318 TaxID=3157031 RepID=UPI0033A7F8EB